MALELTSYDLLPQSLPSFARGFAAAFIATVSCYPLDTIRRHIQLQVRGGAGCIERVSVVAAHCCGCGPGCGCERPAGHGPAPHPAAGVFDECGCARGRDGMLRLCAVLGCGCAPCACKGAWLAPTRHLKLTTLPLHSPVCRRAAPWPSTWLRAPS